MTKTAIQHRRLEVGIGIGPNARCIRAVGNNPDAMDAVGGPHGKAGVQSL